MLLLGPDLFKLSQCKWRLLECELEPREIWGLLCFQKSYGPFSQWGLQVESCRSSLLLCLPAENRVSLTHS